MRGCPKDLRDLGYLDISRRTGNLNSSVFLITSTTTATSTCGRCSCEQESVIAGYRFSGTDSVTHKNRSSVYKVDCNSSHNQHNLELLPRRAANISPGLPVRSGAGETSVECGPGGPLCRGVIL